MKRILTGITTSGTPHLGNYVGAIRPAIESIKADTGAEHYFFLADLHALIKSHDPQRLQESTLEIAATWLALGLDPSATFFYRQSDVPEISELNWFLSCLAAKGLMNRAHAYKAQSADNIERGEDADFGISMGLYSYPVLMSADILLFNATHVPVGKDQIQHIEMARDIAGRFNHHYGETFTLPSACVDEKVAVLSGQDGRKMSKSYDNTIPLFLPEKQLKKAINKIKTNLLEPGEPKDPDSATVFQIYQAFASKAESDAFASALREGLAWGESKKQLFELINSEIGHARERYYQLLEKPDDIYQQLTDGASRVRQKTQDFIRLIKERTGIRQF